MSSEERQHKTGFSVGTIIVIVLSAITAIGCLIVFPILRGSGDLRSDTREFVSVLEDAMRSRDATMMPNPTENTAVVATATVAPVMTQAPAQSSHFSFTFAGACDFGKSIQRAVETSGTGYAPLLETIASEMTGDVKVASLENGLVVQNKGTNSIDPIPGVLDALTAAKIDLVLLGHERALDYGDNGVSLALNLFKDSNIVSTGLHTDASDERFLQFSVLGMPAVVMHYIESPLSADSQRNLNDKDASHFMNPFDINTIAQDIANMRAVGVKLVIVSLHWGTVGINTPTALQKEQAQLIANAGADIIIGAHSGVVQPIEVLNAQHADGTTSETLVAYSLGSLLCDGEDENGNRQGTYISGILLHVTLSWNAQTDDITFDTLSYTPTYIWRQNMNNIPQYRVIASDLPVPPTMISTQVETMEKAFKRIQDVLAGSPVVLRVLP